MKLFNMLVVGSFAMLAAAGCSSTTTTTTDGGATATDTGTTPVDTGTKPDTGTAPVDAGNVCEKCLVMNCAAESVKCDADAKCKERLACMDACADTACRNKCISDIATTAGDDVITCIQEKCKTECPI